MAKCSATRDSVAAKLLCSATPFECQHDLRYPRKGGWRCDSPPEGGIAQLWRDTPKPLGKEVRQSVLHYIQKRSGDPNPQYFSKSTAVQMGGVLPYKWEAYCSTNGRRTAGFPFLRSLEARKARRYKWGAYCRTNWRCIAVLFRQVVGVGVSETLPIRGGPTRGSRFGPHPKNPYHGRSTKQVDAPHLLGRMRAKGQHCQRGPE